MLCAVAKQHIAAAVTVTDLLPEQNDCTGAQAEQLQVQPVCAPAVGQGTQRLLMLVYLTAPYQESVPASTDMRQLLLTSKSPFTKACMSASSSARAACACTDASFPMAAVSKQLDQTALQ
jgi:hypothetical protein